MTTYEWPMMELPLKKVSAGYRPPTGFSESKASLEDLCTHRLATGLQEAREKIAEFECDHQGLTIVRTGDRARWGSIDELVGNRLRSLEVPNIKKIRLVGYQLVDWEK